LWEHRAILHWRQFACYLIVEAKAFGVRGLDPLGLGGKSLISGWDWPSSNGEQLGVVQGIG
jgi:hypothetical protein